MADLQREIQRVEWAVSPLPQGSCLGSAFIMNEDVCVRDNLTISHFENWLLLRLQGLTIIEN